MDVITKLLCNVDTTSRCKPKDRFTVIKLAASCYENIKARLTFVSARRALGNKQSVVKSNQSLAGTNITCRTLKQKKY